MMTIVSIRITKITKETIVTLTIVADIASIRMPLNLIC